MHVPVTGCDAKECGLPVKSVKPLVAQVPLHIALELGLDTECLSSVLATFAIGMSLLGSWWSGKPSSEGEGEDKPESWVEGLGSEWSLMHKNV